MNEALKSDDALVEALEEAEIAVLLMVLVHLTGDRKWLAPPYQPKHDLRVFGDLGSGLDETVQGEVRREAAEAISAFLQSAARAVEVPSPELLVEMMSACVGEPVPAEYAEMMLEEMGFADREVRWGSRPSPETLAGFHVTVIGAGVSGLCVAMKLQALGIPYTVVEKNASVGGTWFENTYPGCAVDVPNHFYSYSFEPNHDWPDYYSKRDELHRYFEACAHKYGVTPNIRFFTEVVGARWSPETQRWTVRVRGTGVSTPDAETVIESNVVVSAVGQLNRPKVPAVPGLERFSGPAFHSARWPEGLDLSGQRVAVVGTGASAMQLAPATAEVADRLVIFQRSPQWAIPNDHYRRTVPEEKKWLLKHLPFYAGWYRFRLLWRLADGLWPTLQVDPNWPDLRHSINEINERVRQALTRHIMRELGDRPELVAKAMPDYPPFSKRMVIDNGWFKMLGRDNVALVTDGIAEITADSVRTDAGEEFPVDAIVFATGFESTRMLWPMGIEGASGRSLAQVWDDDDPRAYLGIAVPDFPNLFCLYGPNTNLGHGGSIIFNSECQTRYIVSCIRELLEGRYASMEVTPDAHDEYNRRLDETIGRMIWSCVDVGSWYKNSRQRVVTNLPWRLVDYWKMTREPDLAAFNLRKADAGPE